MVTTGSTYLSSSDKRLNFRLGANRIVKLLELNGRAERCSGWRISRSAVS
jgi:hypothetical protein